MVLVRAKAWRRRSSRNVVLEGQRRIGWNEYGHYLSVLYKLVHTGLSGWTYPEWTCWVLDTLRLTRGTGDMRASDIGLV